jgi:hypothetical protein
VLAKDLASRASSDGPDASTMVKSKFEEIRILLDRYEMDNSPRASDDTGSDQGMIRNPPVIRGKGRPRVKRVRSLTEQAAAAGKRARRVQEDVPCSWGAGGATLGCRRTHQVRH